MQWNIWGKCLALILFAGLFSGCMAAKTGVVGSALTKNTYPRVTMSANAPLVLRGYGELPVSFTTDSMTAEASGTMNYAIYAEGSSGPVTRAAHVLIAQLGNDARWMFQPATYSYNSVLSVGTTVLNGSPWTAQTMRIIGEEDWFSALWSANGRETPPLWIARRFSTMPGNATRLVAEYREPWPECLDAGVIDLAFARPECINDFMARSEKAFTLEMNTTVTGNAPSLPALKTPAFAPNMTQIAGQVTENVSFMGWR